MKHKIMLFGYWTTGIVGVFTERNKKEKRKDP